MNTSIFIRGCAHDLGYLDLCLKSIRKFATGFYEVVVVVADYDRVLFKQLAERHQVLLKDYPGAPDRAQGQICAQWAACMADTFVSKGAELIAFVDSDCVFIEPVTPADYIINVKPVLCIESYSRMPPGYPWKSVVEETLKFQVEFDTMRRHPALHYPKMLPLFRDYVCLAHGLRVDRGDLFRQYVLSRKGSFPWGFTEFNALGAFALAAPAWKDQYHWIDLGHEPRPKSKLRQFWSLSPPDKPQHAMMPGDGMVNIVPMEFCQKLGIT